MKEMQTDLYSYEQLSRMSLEQIRKLRKQSTKRSERIRVPALVSQERGSSLPLSYAQERLWFLDQLGLVGAAYNIPMALRLKGNLNVTALERSFVELIRRHESLRTRFEVVGGGPIQVIAPPDSFTLEVRDLSGLQDGDKEIAVTRLGSAEANTPFDLAKESLLRVCLLKLDALVHVLLLTMHHIISDGWSLGVLQRELGALYDAYCKGKPSPLPELPVQYADYAIWQRNWLQGEVLQNQLQYWSKQLIGAPPQLQLPTDRPRPVVASFKGATLNFQLPAALRESLEKLARDEGATLFMVVLSAYQVMLSQYSGQQDVVVGSGIAGRTNAQTEGLIGFFVNTLTLRTDLSGNPSFRDLIGRVKEVTLGAYAHQDLPFEKLVKELRPERNLTSQPIFQVALALQNFPEEQLELAGLTWTRIDSEQVTALFDLTLHLFEVPDGLLGTFEYATDLFDRGTIERMAGHFRTLLDGVVSDPNCPVQNIDLLTETDRAQVLHAFNDTIVSYAGNQLIHELFEAQVERTPDALAVVCGDQQLTYAQLNRRANQLAHALLASGVRPDERVGVYIARSVETVISLLGILKAGGGYVPLDVSYPTERLEYMLRDSAPKVLLTHKRLKENIPVSGARIITIDEDRDEISRHPDLNLDPARSGLASEHLAYVIYTSGSTGTPRGVMVAHHNVINLIRWHCAAFDLSEGCCCSSVAAVGFDAAVWEMWPPLSAGATLVLASSEVAQDAEALLAWWASQPLDVSFLPTPMAELAFSRNIQNPNLRALLVGGDRLRHRPELQSFSLVNNYGPTEATVVATSGCIHPEDAVLHIGRPIANTQIYILDPHLRPVPIRVAGEIYIGGSGVARGYLNCPELTAERFLPHPFSSDPSARVYKTGDLGRWCTNGTIEYLGRNDHQIKIRGYRIELGEIEAQLLEHPLVKEAVVLAHEDEPGEKRLVSYIIGNRDAALEAVSDVASEKLRGEIVSGWETLYEQTYGPQNHTSAPSFVGWNSSYTGQPIPEPQMEEWLSCAVERIQALRPSKVLEIGCGVGLILQRLAPQCTVYVGTDISSSAVDKLRQWTSRRDDLKHVQLMHRSATELHDLPSGSFDTVVLNSVVQYFPDVEYLLAVLRDAIRLLGPGGKIFLGDVRHFGLLQTFHSAVQLSKAAANVSVGQLRSRTARAVVQDKELVIDPKFFQVLHARVPGISTVEVQLKRGRAPNELTRYRYDVVLHTNEETIPRAVYEPLKWGVAVGSVAELATALRERRWCAVRLSTVQNARLAKEAAAQRLIEESDERLDASSLRRQLDELNFGLIDPSEFWELGQAHGYDVQVNWNTEGSPECFDVQLLDRARADQVPRALAPLPDAVELWTTYANDPLENGFNQQVVPQLREYLKQRLPEYMVPSAWMVVKQLPLTPNGKVDRRALANTQRALEVGEYIAPRTELERTLAEIWAQVLRVDRVGVRDDFFELGGHSLLATQVIVRIQSSLSVKMPMRLLFEFPTVEQLSAQVNDLREANLLDDIEQGGDEIAELLDRVAAMPESTVNELVRDMRARERP